MELDEAKFLIRTPDGIEPCKIHFEMMSDIKIEWTFTEISLAEITLDHNNHNYFSGELVGSSHLLGDEGFIFDPETLRLVSISLMTPEENFDGEDALGDWLNTPVVEGVPVIKSPRKFSVESPLDYRFFSVKNEILLCISADYIDARTNDCSRLRLHPDIEILCVNGVYIGYILKNAVRYLTRFSEDNRLDRMAESSPILAECLAEYFSIVHDDYFERLEEQDINLKNRLMVLIDKLQKLDNSFEQVYALADRCKVILEDYYT